MRQKAGDLGQEWIGEDACDFLVANAARIAHQLRDVHTQSQRQALERTQRRDRLAVLDLRNIGSRHLHPAGELTLAQMTSAANLAHLPSHLQTRFR